MLARIGDEPKERDLSWLDWSLAIDLFPDGRVLLFDESGEGGGKGYSVYVRNTNGSPATRLGEGSAQSLSPDGKWVLAIVASTADARLVAYPTGAGQPRTFDKDGLTVQDATFLPDGKRILMNANEEGRAVRIYLRDFAGGKPRAVTPEGYRAFPRTVSLDSRSVVVRRTRRRSTFTRSRAESRGRCPGFPATGSFREAGPPTGASTSAVEAFPRASISWTCPRARESSGRSSCRPIRRGSRRSAPSG